jgi:hypothetical protein
MNALMCNSLEPADLTSPLRRRGKRSARVARTVSEAVLTEVFHLVHDSRTEAEAAWKAAVGQWCSLNFGLAL